MSDKYLSGYDEYNEIDIDKVAETVKNTKYTSTFDENIVFILKDFINNSNGNIFSANQIDIPALTKIHPTLDDIKAYNNKYENSYRKDLAIISQIPIMLFNINHYYNNLNKYQQDEFNKLLTDYVKFKRDFYYLQFSNKDKRFIDTAREYYSNVIKNFTDGIMKLNVECNTIALNSILNNDLIAEPNIDKDDEDNE